MRVKREDKRERDTRDTRERGSVYCDNRRNRVPFWHGRRKNTHTDGLRDGLRKGRTDGRERRKEGRKEGEQKTEILFLSPFLWCKRICVVWLSPTQTVILEWMDDWMHGKEKRKGTLD
jgi:hypothetical protein